MVEIYTSQDPKVYPGWVYPRYSFLLRASQGGLFLFLYQKEPPRVGYSWFCTQQRASPGGLFLGLYPGEDLPG